MQVYSRNTLIDRMITAMRAESSAITYFGPGPTRSILSAVAGELQHLYYSLFQTEQANSVLSASGSALDSQAAERGLQRRGASAASTLLTIEATATITGTGTISTSGTTVNGTGTQFMAQLKAGDTIIVGSTSAVVTTDPVDNDGPITVGSSALGTLTNSAFQIKKASVTIPVAPTPLQVTSTGGAIFQATSDVTLVPTFAGSNLLRGVVPMISTSMGPTSNVAPLTLRRVVNPTVVPLVTIAVTNRVAAQGGASEETDGQLRSRIVNVVASLNQGTTAFYEAQARSINDRVIRVYLARGASLNEVLVYCLTSDGATLTPAEKSTLKTELSDVVPVQTQVTIRDMILEPINVSFSTTLRPGFSLAAVRDELVESYRQMLNWSTWTFGQVVQADDLLRVASGTSGIDRLDVSTFLPQADIPMPAATLPRIGEIQILNSATGESLVIDDITSQYPRLD